MLDSIRNSGVIGAGGAGFPTHVKLKATAEYVLVNGAECEPLLRVDQELMATYALEMVNGLKVTMEEVGASRGVICLKGKYKKAIKKLSEVIKDDDSITIHELNNVYPSGDEQYIVYSATGRIVPEGGIPLAVGVVVINVETLINVSKAQAGIPVTHKYVTIAGAIRQAKTLYVPVGISLNSLIELCGGTTTPNYRVIDGGPMMGRVTDTNDLYVKKTSKGFIILPEEADLIKSKLKSMSQMMKEAKTACCHCNLCTEVCPRNLLGHNIHPAKLMRIASYGTLGDKHTSLDEAYLCCECGLCEIACVMNLQPWKLNIMLKNKLKEAGVQNSNKKTELEVHPFYKYREFPVKKLVQRLGLGAYDVPAPMEVDSIKADRVRIYASQHIGAPGKCAVAINQSVECGDIIYDVPDKALGAIIHSSISGTVSKVMDTYVEVENRK